MAPTPLTSGRRGWPRSLAGQAIALQVVVIALIVVAGSALALRVLRRHRLIEQFLANTLNLSWDEVHEEAENMEHAVSDMLVDRIDEFLGFPEFDPHGDPIPKADGTMSRSDSKRLSKCRVGGVFRLVRVMDQSPEFLRFLADAGLPLGAEGTLTSLEPQAGTLTVRINEQETTIGLEAAEKLLVAGT